ncbi:NAD(P)/FAD-dependent oxidoreductase [Falsibacillus albus]|uniref:FAD-binding oxidoreductase n=1 Tax=Falsibacillus albus TaxID=2478915 RepID=A0A3L7JW25_9BACI|nr:FAD-binding oxidoreductase [Falsibacillus albus]RLQ93861.1 FAD-binding oxidoreductase [Falsibacillus albus]
MFRMKKVIVVGAGILGASTAYHLANAGVEVTLVDRFDRGQATDAAAGIVCPWISQRRNKDWYQLVKGGARYYPQLINQLKELCEKETGYNRVGAISLHKDPVKLEKMAERAQKRREDAPEIGDIQILSPAEARSMFPPLSDEYGAVYISGGARVNGRSLRNALIQSAFKKGADFLKGSASLVFEGNRVTGVRVQERTLDTEQVIVTGGAWSKELLSPLGIEFKVSPQKAQIVHLELQDMDTANWPVVMPPNDQYILTFEGGRVVVGATHENEAGFDDRVTAGGLNEILGKALEIAPGLGNGRLMETRVGFRPFTPDFLPVFGPVPYFDGLFAANGLGASGLTSGPYLGAEVAKLVLGMPTELDPSHYDISGAIEHRN